MNASTPLLCALLLLYSIQHYAQNDPLVGTWKLSSAQGTGSDGKPFSYNDTQIKQIKIITPTHFMFITEVLGDSAGFVRAGGGTYILDGNKYIETLATASWQDYDKSRTDFTWKVEGDTFYQDGILTFADGSQAEIHEVWQKVNLPAQSIEAIGTWKRLTATYTDENGQQGSIDGEQEKQVLIITPTHWMRITEDVVSKKFLAAGGGTYTIEGNKYLPTIDLASIAQYKNEKYEVRLDIEGDKMVLKEINLHRRTTWINTYQRLASNTELAKSPTVKQ